MKKINNVIEFHKKSKPANINSVEENELDDVQELLEQDIEKVERTSQLKLLEVQSIAGQIAFVERLWKDFKFSEFEIKLRKSKYYNLISGRKMTYLMNKFEIENNSNERLSTINEVLKIYQDALKIVDVLYDVDFTPKNTQFDKGEEINLLQLYI